MSTESREPFDFDVSGMPGLPRIPGLFVTSPGRGEGKTTVAGAVARHLRRGGHEVEVFHPVATGCRRDRGGLLSPEADFLAACAESRRTLSEIAPVRSALPVAPSAATDIKGGAAGLDAVFDAWRRLAGQADAVVVEGVGGLLCPITEDFWTVHLAKMLALPVVIVVRPHPGAIDHALLTIHAARSAGLALAGVVVNGYRPDAAAEPDVDLHMERQPDQIARLGRVPILAFVPQDADNSVLGATLASSTQFAIDQAPWEKIIFTGGRPRPASGGRGA